MCSSSLDNFNSSGLFLPLYLKALLNPVFANELGKIKITTISTTTFEHFVCASFTCFIPFSSHPFCELGIIYYPHFTDV